MIGSWSVTPPKAVAEAAAARRGRLLRPQPRPLPRPGFTTEQKQELEKIIKNYLVANPEIFLEVQTALEAKMEKEQAEKLKVAIAENARDIYRDPNADIAGNPNGDITVVEFFDYNCGYCKRGLHDVIKLVESDPKVRVVFKELPILSKGSEEASRVAIAAGKQGKYWDMHKAMLEAKGQMNEANALAIATKLGLDIDKAKEGHGLAGGRGGDQEVGGTRQEDGRQRHTALPRRRPRHSRRPGRPLRPAREAT